MRALPLVAIAAAALVAAGAAGSTPTGAKADPSFVSGRAIAGGNCEAASADFNRDGKADLALAACYDNRVDILLGDGKGAFAAAPGSPVKTGKAPASLAVADYDRNGTSDLAVADYNSNQLTILLGSGTGAFAPAPGSPVAAGKGPSGLQTADLNGDGKADLLAEVNANSVVALLGDGAGRFTPAASPVKLPGSSAEFGTGTAVGDVNGDRKVDLVVANSDEKSLYVMLGNGAGMFAKGKAVAAVDGPRSIEIVDVNGDGRRDLVVVNIHGVTIGVRALLGDGKGAFKLAPGSPLAIPGTPYALAVADLNGDRRLDLAVGMSEGSAVAVLVGTGAGRFRPAADSPFGTAGNYPWILAADANGDRLPDLVVREDKGSQVLLQTARVTIARGKALPGSPNAVTSTRGLVTDLAADGSQVAVMTSPKNACGRIVVWSAPGKKVVSIPTEMACPERSQPTSPYLDSLALGAGAVTWIEGEGGNYLYLHLVSQKLSGGKAKELNYTDTDYDSGDGLGRLFGEGALVFYNSWYFCNVDDDEYSQAPDCTKDDPGDHAVQQRLYRVANGKDAAVRKGPGAYRLDAVGGGRVALDVVGAISVRSPGGSLVATVPAVKGDPLREVALSKTHLAVQRASALELYAPSTGKRTRSLPLGSAAGLRLAGVNAQLALLAGPRRLVLVRLRDGRLMELPLQPGAAAHLAGAKLTRSGLFYGFNVPTASARGRIVYQPTARLLRRFR